MPLNFKMIGTDIAVGAAGGIASKLAADYDDTQGKTKFFEQAGNLVDYGVPLLGIAASFFGYLKGDMETRVITMGATLAGRRGTGDIKLRMNPYDGGAAKIRARSTAQAAAAEALAVKAAAAGHPMRMSAWRPQAVQA